MSNVKWGEYRLGDLFEIKKTLSFNADKLSVGNDYDYVTRTSFNQGILQTTGFVNNENINPSGTWSLGLLKMDFFYRNRPWYAGQFVRKIIPKIPIPQGSILYFTTLLNKQKKKMLSVLVRDIDKTFEKIMISLPETSSNSIDFEFIESFIAELEAERVAELSAYLKVSGLENYELSSEEEEAIQSYEKLNFEGYDLADIFTVKNTSNILSRDIVENSGTTPYLCASEDNNGVSTYISYDKRYLEKGNCIFIGGKTFVVSYQENDFYSNDSHNLALYLQGFQRTKSNQLYLATCIYKSLSHKYSWGDSVSKAKIQSEKIYLPSEHGKPNLQIMQTFITAIEKLVMKEVVLHTDKKLANMKKVINKKS